ncbi:zinc finger protein 271-like isoform X3 [Mercenaria mercenaria]|uniref:zinc finger protein 271-like isoform X3 n=1 Tax=Mercenaria mercenaria TaxID=6596 RepID=UPI00234F3885|nr:zinc finger protein 271-like isoform X3 [Mercenaria mercenaria]
MESYLMMLYVTLEQESALKNFFVDQGWTFCKPDLSVTTDRLGPSVKDVHTDSAHSENSLRQLGERKTNLKQHLAPVVELATDIPVPASMKNEEQTFSIVQADTEGTEQLKQNEAELQDIGDMKGLSDITCNPDKPKVKVETFEVTLNDDFNDDDDEDTDVDYSYNEADAKSKMKANVSNITEDNAEDEVGITEEDKKAEATQPREPKVFGNQGRKYQCLLCNTDYNKRYELVGHMRRVHQGDTRTYQCSYCEIRFTHKSNKIRHEKHKHLGIVNRVCEKRGKTFQSKNLLEGHIRKVHHPETKFKCKFCNRGFSFTYSLKDHEIICRRKNYTICNLCHKEFKSAKDLDEHLIAVHNVSRKVSCNICRKTFAQPRCLENHLKHIHKIN